MTSEYDDTRFDEDDRPANREDVPPVEDDDSDRDAEPVEVNP